MDVDYRLAFNLAPVGLCLSRNRAIVDCNQQLCEMFGATREQLIGQSFQILYPSADEYERLGARMAPILNARGHYSDDRIMKRANGEVLLVPRDRPRAQPRRAARGRHLDLRGPQLAPAGEGRADRPRARGGRPPDGRHDLQGNRQGPGRSATARWRSTGRA